MNGQLGEPSSLTRIIRSFRKYSRASRYVMAGTRGSLSLGGGKGCAESIRNVSSSSEPVARSSLAKVSGPINYLEGFYITVGSVR